MTATRRRSPRPGCRSSGSAPSTTRRPGRCSTPPAPDLPIGARTRVLREAAGNPLALLELPTTAEHEGDLVPLTERLERAFAARVSDLPAGHAARPARRRAQRRGGARTRSSRRRVRSPPATLGLEAAEPAADAGIADVDLHTLRFRHPLIRSAVAQSAGLADRRRVHEALAGVLEDQRPPRLAPRGAAHGRARGRRGRARGRGRASAAARRRRRGGDRAAPGRGARHGRPAAAAACWPPPRSRSSSAAATSSSRCCARSTSSSSASSTARGSPGSRRPSSPARSATARASAH